MAFRPSTRVIVVEKGYTDKVEKKWQNDEKQSHFIGIFKKIEKWFGLNERKAEKQKTHRPDRDSAPFTM